MVIHFKLIIIQLILTWSCTISYKPKTSRVFMEKLWSAYYLLYSCVAGVPVMFISCCRDFPLSSMIKHVIFSTVARPGIFESRRLGKFSRILSLFRFRQSYKKYSGRFTWLLGSYSRLRQRHGSQEYRPDCLQAKSSIDNFRPIGPDRLLHKIWDQAVLSTW